MFYFESSLRLCPSTRIEPALFQFETVTTAIAALLRRPDRSGFSLKLRPKINHVDMMEAIEFAADLTDR